MSSFKRYVEVGRVVVLNEGEQKGKLAVIADIIDHNKAIIDGPSTGVPRQALRYRYLSLTRFTLKGLPRGAGSPVVKKFFDKENMAKQWAESTWAKKQAARKHKGQMTDFDRFNVMLLKKQRRRIINGQVKKVKV